VRIAPHTAPVGHVTAHVTVFSCALVATPEPRHAPQRRGAPCRRDKPTDAAACTGRDARKGD